jgi:hypothetical protein
LLPGEKELFLGHGKSKLQPLRNYTKNAAMQEKQQQKDTYRCVASQFNMNFQQLYHPLSVMAETL